MENLVEQMRMDLSLQGYSEKTIESYMWHVRNFTAYFEGRIADLTEDDLRRYLYYIKEDLKYGRSYLVQAFSAIKYLYRETLSMPLKLNKLKGPRRDKRLPVVLSREEVRKIFEVTSNQKHRMILMTIYSGGLRLSESTNLKITDIDSQRMQIHIRRGKGKKDRYTLLSSTLLSELREYWKVYRPLDWLFPGSDMTRPLCTTTVQKVFYCSKKKPRYTRKPRFTRFATVLQPTY